MATIAFDSSYEKEAAKPPLSLHPAFPAIVALWFAALLGIGSLVLPGVLLERAVAASGIGSIFAAANPPLGFTARALIALLAALLGAGLGLAIARRVAEAHSPQPESRIAKLAGGGRRPISVHDELGGEGVVNGEALPLNRRRALAISEDDRPSDFLYQVPLPGVDPDAAAPIDAVSDEEEPLELCELAEEPQDDAEEDMPMTDSPETSSAWPSHQHLPAEQHDEIEERDLRNNRAGARGLEPLPFSAPSLARRTAYVEFEAAAAPEPEFAPESEPDAEPEPQAQLEAVAGPAANDEPECRADWETAPLDGLGLVQLVQRLGSTIERRRELAAQHASTEPVAAASFSAPDLEPAPAEEAVQAMAAFFNSAPAACGEPEPECATEDGAVVAEDHSTGSEPAPPAFLRALSLPADESEDADDLPDFSLPIGDAVVEDGVDDEAYEEENGEPAESRHGSLLGMTNPFAAPRGEFVRIEEPSFEDEPAEPAVVFPGHEEAARLTAAAAAPAERRFDPPGTSSVPVATPAKAPADADAALRAALATLQRMSGAA